MKRFIDLSVSFSLLLILFFPMVVLYFLVRAKLGRPAIYLQLRPGLQGKLFKMYKFRTMTNEADSLGQLLSDEQRLTTFGKKMRAMSLDELPELLNVIKGEMSLVGPRPLLPEYLNYYTPEQARRHEVLPGVTGWAQVNGRNAVSWAERFKMDTWYVDHQSALLDIKILFLTALKVLKKEGITTKEGTTMPLFKGNLK